METCGPTPGPVPNAGGAPAGCCEGSCASAGAMPAALAAAAAKPTAVSAKNSRRVFAMWPPPGILPGLGQGALEFVSEYVEFLAEREKQACSRAVSRDLPCYTGIFQG